MQLLALGLVLLGASLLSNATIRRRQSGLAKPLSVPGTAAGTSTGAPESSMSELADELLRLAHAVGEPQRELRSSPRAMCRRGSTPSGCS